MLEATCNSYFLPTENPLEAERWLGSKGLQHLLGDKGRQVWYGMTGFYQGT
jgi:hypothetical protein